MELWTRLGEDEVGYILNRGRIKEVASRAGWMVDSGYAPYFYGSILLRSV
jgi:hypothetical protein